MRELSLFTGAGGGILGSKLLGWTTIGYVEINEYCQRILKQRIKDGIVDNAPIFGDIRAFNDQGYADGYKGLVDVVTGGFPCQDISSAGSGRGLNGERSGLFFEMARTIRSIQPRYLLMENSPMLTIRGLDRVLYTIAKMGYNARWCNIGADAVGFPHRRSRLWIFAYTTREQWRRMDESKKDRRTNMHIKNIEEKFRQDNLPFSVGRFNVNPRSGVHRNDDGLATGLDRLKALGNGQVPAVVRAAWQILTN